MAEVLKIKPRLAPDQAEEIVRRVWEETFKGRKFGEPKPKPVLAVTSEPLSPKVAEVAKANPAGVEMRVIARDAEGVAWVEPPKPPREIVHVLEVDGQARPKLSRNIDCATGDVSFVEYAVGYRPQAGAVSDYNPLDALDAPARD
jgi:hypothetical protein